VKLLAWAKVCLERTAFAGSDDANVCACCGRFNRAIQECGTDSVRVVATAALRDARNSRTFLDRYARRRGGRSKSFPDWKKARLIHLGLVSARRLGAKSVLLVDLGGGSCELTLSRSGQHSVDIGEPAAWRRALSPAEFRAARIRHAKGELEAALGIVAREIARVQDRVPVGARVGAVIATSGTAAALAGVASHLAGKGRTATYAAARDDPTISPNSFSPVFWNNERRCPESVRAAPRSFAPVRWCNAELLGMSAVIFPASLLGAGPARWHLDADGGGLRSQHAIGPRD